MKRLVSIVIVPAVAMFTALAGTPALAQATGEALSIHGFGGWAAGYTSNDNDFNDIASHDVAVDNLYFTLNLLARPAQSVTIHAQPTWSSDIRGRELSLDLAYVEWALSPDFKLRAGKIRNPLGIYTEIFKVGTLRPFYLLPNAMYRNGPESYVGGGLNRLQKLGSWELEAEILGGQMDFEPGFTDLRVATNPQTGAPIFASVHSQRQGRDLIGGGLLLRPPVQGLEISLASYGTEIWAGPVGAPLADVSDERTTVLTGGVEYVTDSISLRTEAMGAWGNLDFQTGYVELAYMVTEHWQVAAQYDMLRRKDPPAIVKSLGDHSAIGVALNFWVNPKLVWKADYYHVTDNYLARPEDAVNLALAGELAKSTDVVILGLHFAF